MAWSIDHVEDKVLRASLLENGELEGNRTAFHSYPPLLLIIATVEISHFSSHFCRHNIVRSKEGIHEGGFPVVDMSKCSNNT